MGRAPLRPEEIFSEFIKDYQGIFGNDIVSIILYGSAASGAYVPRKSDINFLIVLKNDALMKLEDSISIVEKWLKRRVSIPLFLNLEELRGSVDVFPIEILNFKASYKVAYGDDVISELSIKPEHLRLQCERELRGKLIALRQGYLKTKAKTKEIKQLISGSIVSFIAIFKGLAYLLREKVPTDRIELVNLICNKFEVDSKPFSQCINLHYEKINLSKEEIHVLINSYIKEVQKLVYKVDKIVA